ncbi:MAG: FtsW/RodA/SpoVE family cell cycle protein [Candidatus Saccharibacteria bacterium]|nr:FtsW/RodA/SpoVE family cell cycle protein [Candidatus Saccharibacteria bacterium]
MRKHKSDLAILFAVIALLAIGAVIIYAIGPMRANVLNSAYGMNYEPSYFFIHHLISVILALTMFFVAFKVIPREKISQFSKWFLIAGLAASAALWLLSKVGSSIAVCELGACRWLSVGGMSFQPAELLKISLVIYLANFIERKKSEGKIGTKDFWVPIAVISALSLFFVVVLQSDLGTGLAIMAIILSILLVSGVPLKQFLLVIGVIVAGGVAVVLATPYRLERVMTFMSGGTDESSYHVENAMVAIGTGGLFGVGVGNSVQATGYLPESINDSVFAVMGETFGLIGLVVVLGVFCVILLRTLKVAEGTEDLEGRLIAIGIFAWIATHVVVNIMAMTGLIPVTGVTLPLMSYGGTSMVFISFGLGLVMQLSCYTSREVKKKDESISSGRGLGRTHHSSRSRGTGNS